MLGVNPLLLPKKKQKNCRVSQIQQICD